MKIHLNEEDMTEVIPEKDRCQFGMCAHGPEEHDKGSCFHITQEDLAKKPTNKKFCPCGINDGQNLRLYEDLGFMEPTYYDTMVTKDCRKCGKTLLINVDNCYCLTCRSNLC